MAKKTARKISSRADVIPFFFGTAGWSIPKQDRDLFFAKDVVKPNHLEAYSKKFTAVEINSSFYREHQANTYAKWAQSTPANFRFSVKLAKRFTHVQKLKVDSGDLRAVIEGIENLCEKLGVLLIQIPPKLEFDGEVAEEFFSTLRELHSGPIALEPRHVSWTARDATATLEEYRIARVIADPDRIGLAPIIKKSEIVYFRLHGSPKTYYSSYERPALKNWAKEITDAAEGKTAAWCIFDNTALGHATSNALAISKFVSPKRFSF